MAEIPREDKVKVLEQMGLSVGTCIQRKRMIAERQIISYPITLRTLELFLQVKTQPKVTRKSSALLSGTALSRVQVIQPGLHFSPSLCLFLHLVQPPNRL